MSTKVTRMFVRDFWQGDMITSLAQNQIFVFGSNPEGRHGKGSALFAKKHFGAKCGKGRGMTGQCYALPTTSLNSNFTDMDFPHIHYNYRGGILKEQVVDEIVMLYEEAEKNPKLQFLVGYTYDYVSETNKNIFETKKGLSGYDSFEILELFMKANEKKPMPENIIFSISHLVPIKEIYPQILSL